MTASGPKPVPRPEPGPHSRAHARSEPRSEPRPDPRPDPRPAAPEPSAPFDALAAWYDAVYAARGRDAEAEAARVLARLAAARGGTTPRSLLDVACGTGTHLAAFGRSVPEVAGVEPHPAMRAAATGRPGVPPVTDADMRTMDLGRPFDAVTCLFASVGYLPGPTDLTAALGRMAAHLAPGGALAVEPPLAPDALAPPARQVTRVERDGTILERVTTARRDGSVLRIRFELVLRRPGAPPERAVEEHPVRLFTDAELDAALAAAGLAGRLERGDAPPRRLIVARRVADPGRGPEAGATAAPPRPGLST